MERGCSAAVIVRKRVSGVEGVEVGDLKTYSFLTIEDLGSSVDC